MSVTSASTVNARVPPTWSRWLSSWLVLFGLASYGCLRLIAWLWNSSSLLPHGIYGLGWWGAFLLFISAGAVTGLVLQLLVSQMGRAIPLAALRGIVAWATAFPILYALPLGPYVHSSFPQWLWSTTTWTERGAAGGLIYSGWHFVAGAIMGLVFSLLWEIGSTRSTRVLWRHFATALVGAISFGAVPSGYWIT